MPPPQPLAPRHQFRPPPPAPLQSDPSPSSMFPEAAPPSRAHALLSSPPIPWLLSALPASQAAPPPLLNSLLFCRTDSAQKPKHESATANSVPSLCSLTEPSTATPAFPSIQTCAADLAPPALISHGAVTLSSAVKKKKKKSRNEIEESTG